MEKREEIQARFPDVRWHVAIMPGRHKALRPNDPIDALSERLETMKALLTAKADHPFRIVKCMFGFT